MEQFFLKKYNQFKVNHKIDGWLNFSSKSLCIYIIFFGTTWFLYSSSRGLSTLLVDWLTVWEKRFYTRGSLRGIGIYDWLKFLPFIVIGSDPWIIKRVNHLSFIEGVWKTFTVLHKMPHYLLIYYKISFSMMIRFDHDNVITLKARARWSNLHVENLILSFGGFKN